MAQVVEHLPSRPEFKHQYCIEKKKKMTFRTRAVAQVVARLASQVWDPEFKSQCHQKNKNFGEKKKVNLLDGEK
jgi:hypothetical protein